MSSFVYRSLDPLEKSIRLVHIQPQGHSLPSKRISSQQHKDPGNLFPRNPHNTVHCTISHVSLNLMLIFIAVESRRVGVTFALERVDLPETARVDTRALASMGHRDRTVVRAYG